MDRSGWDAASWVEQELAGSTFKDERLGRRLRKLLVQLADAVGAPIPLACQDWANTKAAYRFLANEGNRGHGAAPDGASRTLSARANGSVAKCRHARSDGVTRSELTKRLADVNPHLYLRNIQRIVDTVFEELSSALARGD